MPIDSGIFGHASNFDDRHMPSLEVLAAKVEHLKGIGLKLVLTSGSFDIFHIGHAIYLEKARAMGDILVVGIDSDAKIRQRKGEGRPVVPEQERMQILSFARPVDVIYLKAVEDAKWALIKAVMPDVLVATEGTYTKEEIAELEKNYCGEVVVLPPQGTSSTTARLRRIQMDAGEKLAEFISKEIPALVQRFNSEVEV